MVRWNVIADQYRIADLHSGMDNRPGRAGGRIRHLSLIHHHDDLAPEVLLVEAKGLFAIPAEIELCIELHVVLRLRGEIRSRSSASGDVSYAFPGRARSR